MIGTKLFRKFFNSEKAGGLILIICTLLSIIITNSAFGNYYIQFWDLQFAHHHLSHWINDGLMTIFFLLIGLELEREIYNGELSNIKNALLPISGAIGGMIVPAIIYLIFNYGSPTQSGAGIPMATDIAFALGILSLLGNKVPTSLKVFLTALAVIDDLGAILIIAFFYTKTIIWSNLIISLSIFLGLLIMNRSKVYNLIPYLVGGFFMWYFMLNSGVHATITGVLLAFAIPFSHGKRNSTSYILQDWLHKPVAFLILPLFALANTAIVFGKDWHLAFTQNYTIGIALGLIIGKPLGIFVFSYLSTKFKICSLPDDMYWKSVIGVGFLGGIGFTMSIFVTLLAFSDQTHIINSKIMIISASVVSGLIGVLFLKSILRDVSKKK